jgi:hypothetical protein
VPLIIAALMACRGGDSDTDGTIDVTDTDDTDAVQLPGSGATIVGAGSQLIGGGLATGDLDGSGYDEIVVGGLGTSAACVFRDPVVGERAYASADACFVTDQPGDLTGLALSIAGGNLAVGAPAWDALGLEGLADVGRVVLTDGDGVPWATFEGGAAIDGFGTSVALADFDGDGTLDLLVGAPGADLGGSNGGVAYVFRGPLAAGPHAAADADTMLQGGGGADTPPPTLRHGNGPQGDTVGNAVAAAGDVDGDGLTDALISAGGTDAGGLLDSGAALLVLGPVPRGNLGSAAADAQISGTIERGFAGEPLAGVGDATGDGLDDVLIAVWGVVPSGAYLFDGRAAWSAELTLADADTLFDPGDPEDGAGHALAGRDLDGDGVAEVAIGAPWADVGTEVDAGEVVIVPGPVPRGVIDLGARGRRYLGVVATDNTGLSVALSESGLWAGAPFASAGAGKVYGIVY